MEVTTGQELNSYQGNAALADGPAGNYVGQAPFDITPLQTYALAKYKTNLENYETQEKDRAKVEAMFLDPNINVPLDEHLAEQIRPKMDEFKQTMAKNPSAYKDPQSWYKIQQLDKELLADNAKLKTVQVAKDNYKKLAGLEPNERKKKNYLEHIAKLEKYKLGEDVPVFNDYFGYDAAHLPSLLTGKVKEQRMVGNKIETVERSVFNGIDALDKAKQQHITNGEVNNTGIDLAKTLLSHGGLEDLNKKLAKAYDDQMTLNFGLLKDKYDKEFATYKKDNPKASFFDFVDAWKLQEEVANMGNKLSYLKKGLEYITDGQEGNPELQHSFTYDENGVRLNVDNDTLRAMYAILENPVGEQETVIDSKISELPSKIKENEANAMKNKAAAGLSNAKVKTENAKQSKLYKQTQAINPLPVSEVPLIAREATLQNVKGKGDQFIVRADNLPEKLRGKAGMGLPEKPKTTDENYATAITAYEAAMKNAKSTYQMRFFDASGNDITDIAIGYHKKGFKIKDILAEGSKNGTIVKFIGQDGNIVGTTESLDRQTLIENNKTNSAKEANLGEDLPEESNAGE